MVSVLDPMHEAEPLETVPVYLCGDISHGVADAEGVLHDNWSLFEMEIPWMWEFHFKNTDAIFNSTFGFGPEERARGIVDLARLKAILEQNAGRFPAGRSPGILRSAGPRSGGSTPTAHRGAARGIPGGPAGGVRGIARSIAQLPAATILRQMQKGDTP